MKKRVWRILSGTDKSVLSKSVNLFIIVLIILNIIAFIISTEPAIGKKYCFWFELFEGISVGIFTIEYLLRLWACSVTRNNRESTLKARFKYIFTPMALVDFVSIAPFYMPFLGLDLRIARILRIFRIFRIFKLSRYTSSLKLLKNVFIKRREELVLFSCITLVLLLLSATLMYYVEHDYQPERFGSIPDSMWWAVVTLTTIGYGDVSPVTPLGKLVTGIIAVLGIGLFALPVGIIGSGIIEEIQHNKENGNYCPHCGKSLKSDDIGQIHDNPAETSDEHT